MKNLVIVGNKPDGSPVWDIVNDWQAPHKNRGTPAKPKRRMSTVLMPRLFKGHRP